MVVWATGRFICDRRAHSHILRIALMWMSWLWLHTVAAATAAAATATEWESKRLSIRGQLNLNLQFINKCFSFVVARETKNPSIVPHRRCRRRRYGASVFYSFCIQFHLNGRNIAINIRLVVHNRIMSFRALSSQLHSNKIVKKMNLWLYSRPGQNLKFFIARSRTHSACILL